MGVYVDMVRQQHAQRAHLVAQGACQFWRESEAQTDCAQCRKLSYITVAIDNQISAVSRAFIRRSVIVIILLYLPSACYSIMLCCLREHVPSGKPLSASLMLLTLPPAFTA